MGASPPGPGVVMRCEWNSQGASLLGLLAAALACGAPAAWGQEVAEAPKASGFDDIVVTARKIEENLQDVPIAVDVFTDEEIFERGIQNFEDLSRLTPGFVFETAFGRQFDRPIIRGQANILGDSGVSVFIDGVNVTQSIRALNFGDVDRVEIIKGPQSALFGRNTYAGAISITTREPTNEFSGDFRVEYGADDLFQALATFRGPLIDDKLFFSLSGRWYSFDSEFNSAADGRPLGEENSRTISGVLDFQPTEKHKLRLRLAYNEDDDGMFAIGFLPFSQLNVNIPGDAASQVGGEQRFFQGVVPPTVPAPSIANQLTGLGGEGGLERNEFFVSLNTSHEFGRGYLLSTIGGFTYEEFRDELDSDALPGSFQAARIFGPFPAGPNVFGVGLIPFDFTTTDDDVRDTFVGEIRLDSPADQRWRWRLGGYLFDESRSDRPLVEHFGDPAFDAIAQANLTAAIAAIRSALGAAVVFNAVPFTGLTPGSSSQSDTRNWAVFGSTAFDFSERLTGTFEARYSIDRLSTTVGGGQSEVFRSFTPRITLDWQATDDNLIYAIVGRGTKPGGFNDEEAIAEGFGSFDEERLWQFELGAKNVFLQDQLLFNFAGFYSTLTGYQLTNALSSISGGTTLVSATSNVGDVDIYGIELDGQFRPSALPGVSLSANYAFTETNFTGGVEEVQEEVFGDPSIVGQDLPRQARHQASFFVDYDVALTNAVSALFSVIGTYQSSRFSQVQNLAETGDSFELDVRATLNFGERWSLTAYGRNLTNEQAVLSVLRFVDANAQNFALNGITVPGVLDLAPTNPNLFFRGFQTNLRQSARWGLIARYHF